jgi:uncharacterized protein YdeI (YjbR/CyaY-like superfamily)
MKEYDALTFTDAPHWRQWLENNYDTCDGIWLRIYKKNSGINTVMYAEALDHALCYGWIDGQKKSYDAQSFLQKFTPRRPRSIWSKRNIEHVERLTAGGLMMPSGLAEVNRAKADGRWDMAYDAAKTMVIPQEFMESLYKNKKAKEFFDTLNKSRLYAIGFRLQTAKKAETKFRRIEQIIANLEKGIEP